MGADRSVTNYFEKLWIRFVFIILFITYSITCYDIYMTVKHAEYIFDMEENPVAKHLMGVLGVGGFLGVKCFVTVIAAQLITIVYVSREVKRRYKTVIEWLLAVWFAEQVVTLYILTH